MGRHQDRARRRAGEVADHRYEVGFPTKSIGTSCDRRYGRQAFRQALMGVARMMPEEQMAEPFESIWGEPALARCGKPVSKVPANKAQDQDCIKQHEPEQESSCGNFAHRSEVSVSLRSCRQVCFQSYYRQIQEETFPRSSCRLAIQVAP